MVTINSVFPFLDIRPIFVNWMILYLNRCLMSGYKYDVKGILLVIGIINKSANKEILKSANDLT